MTTEQEILLWSLEAEVAHSIGYVRVKNDQGLVTLVSPVAYAALLGSSVIHVTETTDPITNPASGQPHYVTNCTDLSQLKKALQVRVESVPTQFAFLLRCDGAQGFLVTVPHWSGQVYLGGQCGQAPSEGLAFCLAALPLDRARFYTEELHRLQFVGVYSVFPEE